MFGNRKSGMTVWRLCANWYSVMTHNSNSSSANKPIPHRQSGTIIVCSSDYYRIKIPLLQPWTADHQTRKVNHSMRHRLLRSSKSPTFTGTVSRRSGGILPFWLAGKANLAHVLMENDHLFPSWTWTIEVGKKGSGGRRSLKTIWFTVMFSFVPTTLDEIITDDTAVWCVSFSAPNYSGLSEGAGRLDFVGK